MRRFVRRQTLVGGIVLVTTLGFVGCQPANETGSSSLSAEVDGDVAYIRLPLRHLTPELVRKTGFNRDHVRDDVYAFGYLTRAALSRLPQAVFDDVVELDAKAWSKHRFDPKSLELLQDEASIETGSFEDYHDYDALTTELTSLAEAHPEIAHLESAGKSVQGRELWLMKISDQAEADEAEPKLLYIANMHGDEVVGREMMIYLIRKLVTDYGHDARITNLVNHAQIYIMPSMNPDGFELGRRYNARGVDLNRDFPDFTSDPSDSPNGRAPETAAVMALHQTHHFVLAINFHGGEVCFNMPWDTKGNQRADDRFGEDGLMRSVARQYADANRTMRVNNGGSFDNGVTYGYEWYEVDGGMQDWSIHYRNSFHATVELSYIKWPSASALATHWQENEESLVAYLEQGVQGMHLSVVDEDGAAINGVTVGVGTARRDVTYPGSVVHRPTLPGEQAVTVSAPGFSAKTLTLAPWAFGDNAQTVTLVMPRPEGP